jgi:AraC family transcriptional regulator
MLTRLHRSNFGQSRSRWELGGLLIEDTLLTGPVKLPHHEHTNGYIAVVLGGGYEQRGRSAFDCRRGSIILHPSGHSHANHIYSSGARCVNLHPRPDWLEHGAFAKLLEDYRHIPLGERSPALRRLERELALNDDAAPLAVTSAVLELMAATVRSGARSEKPRWLAHVIDCLEADLSHTPSLSQLAEHVGVHPSHLARVFRQTYMETVGGYLRRRRLERAEQALISSRRSIAEIALEAGFWDQSHFTRSFRAQFGHTPLEYRRTAQRAY